MHGWWRSQEFVRPPNELAKESKISRTNLKVPSIDLTGTDRGDRHKKIVNEFRRASEKWGFFLVLNHGSFKFVDDMIDGIRKFHEQDVEVSFHLEPDEIPVAYRNVTKLGDTLFELLLEALGLKSDHLKAKSVLEAGALLAIIIQLRHGNQWVNVPSTAGALVVNIGDHLQIILNDKFKSVDHRVLANRVGPRISVALFFRVGPRISVALFFTSVTVPAKIYGPIKDLLSKESPLAYKDFSVGDYMHYVQRALVRRPSMYIRRL
ncbi:hypothetical protein LguiB_025756 [Lonicera macranthoides]